MQEQSGRRSRRFAIVGLALLALGAAAFGGWRYLGPSETAKAESPPKAVPVVTESVARGEFPVYLDSLGTVEALNTVTVRAQVSGQIVRVAFQEGQIVKPGDLLVEIDPRPFQAALTQAEAKLAQDEANLRDARAIFERLDKLAQQQITTRQERDTQAATVNQLAALVEGDRAAIDDARTQLSYTKIQAPIGGRAGFRLVDGGNLVGPSDTGGIVNIQQVAPIAVVFTEPESELGAINAALRGGRPAVDALTTDGRQSIAKGELSLLDNAIDQASGTLRLKATFPNEDGALWSGQSVTTRLLVRTEPNGIGLDENAVQNGPDGLFVYVVTLERKAEIRKVEVGPSQNGRVLVTKGLQGDEEVVVDGQYRLKADTLVEPKKRDGKPAAGGGVPTAALGDASRTAEN